MGHNNDILLKSLTYDFIRLFSTIFLFAIYLWAKKCYIISKKFV
ncbi:hypothetical protein A0O32_0459 [Anoxybacillus flavithermus]|nr:hypothetical protein A0O32_0459 [Anoxybacillus flavithermus]